MSNNQFNTVYLYIIPQPIECFDTQCISFILNDDIIKEITIVNKHKMIKHIKRAAATLKLRHNKHIPTDFENNKHKHSDNSLNNISIIYDHLNNRYIIKGMYPCANRLTLETLCSTIVNEEAGESYNCHNPDLVLNHLLTQTWSFLLKFSF